jgi:hypothetical protein
MRAALVAVLMAVGACVDGPEPMPDAFEEPPILNLYVPIGGRCESASTHGWSCGVDTNGVCVDGTCMTSCRAVGYPRCDAGKTEHLVDLDENTRACFCN